MLEGSKMRIPNYENNEREKNNKKNFSHGKTRPYYVQHSNNNMELNGFRAQRKLTMNIYFAILLLFLDTLSRFK